MGHRRADHSLISNDGFLYCVGSFVNDKFKASCEKYDIENDKWSKISKMTKPRSGVGLCVFNDNFIFAFGGRDQDNAALNRIEVYDIPKDKWTLLHLPDSPWQGAYLAQAYQVSRDKILIFGNSLAQSDEVQNSPTYIFTPDSGTFEESNELSEPSAFANPGVEYEGKVYVIGSRGNIHFFNLNDFTWDIIKRQTVMA